MNYFKVKSVLPSDGSACKVEILQKLDPVQGQFGMEFPYDIKLNDKDLLRWNATQNQVSRIAEVGANVFFIKRWDKDGKTGFNFHVEGDINVQPQNLPKAIATSTIAKNVDSQQEITQERILRGMVFNNACTLLAGSDPNNVLNDVETLTVKLYDKMKDWLANKKPVVHDKDEFKLPPLPF
jgi:hypothetical protein